jgi:hypothetical protein
MTYAVLILPLAMGLLGIAVGLRELRNVRRLAAATPAAPANVAPSAAAEGHIIYGTPSTGYTVYPPNLACQPMPLAGNRAYIGALSLLGVAAIRASRLFKPHPIRPTSEPELRKKRYTTDLSPKSKA